MALIGIFNTLDRRTPFLVVVAFTGLSCAWQLRPFWRAAKDMRGRVPSPGLANWVLSPEGNKVVNSDPGNFTMYDTDRLPRRYTVAVPLTAARRDTIRKLLGYE